MMEKMFLRHFFYSFHKSYPMLSKISSCAVIGLDCERVEVEVDICPGLISTIVVGLPDTAVQESKERVRSAIKNSGASYPTTRVTINLAPADIKKEGPAYDLPIAVGILAASRQLEGDTTEALFVGELALDGTLRHTNGILPVTLFAKEKAYRRVFVPKVDEYEAGLVEGIEIIPVESLAQLVEFLEGRVRIEPARTPDITPTSSGRALRHRHGLYQRTGACETGAGDRGQRRGTTC